MSGRLFDHIDLRVKNRKIAQRFYAQVLPAIGFKVDQSGKEWGQFQPAGKTPVPFFGFTEEPDHKPNGNRIAFWAESRAAVDGVSADSQIALVNPTVPRRSSAGSSNQTSLGGGTR